MIMRSVGIGILVGATAFLGNLKAQEPSPSPTNDWVSALKGIASKLPPLPSSAKKKYRDWKEAIKDPEFRKILEEKSPESLKYVDGFWKHGQGGQPSTPGRLCTAAFMNMDGVLQIAATGGRHDPAGLLLSGNDIPRPASPTALRVTFNQTGSEPAAVTAQSIPLMDNGIGTIVLAAPSLDAVMDGLLDESEFSVDLDGKRIYSLKYHSGKQAMKDLRKCASN